MMDRCLLMFKCWLYVLVGAVLAGGISAPLKAETKLDVLLDWYVNPDHAPLIIADKKGFFEAAGLEITLYPPADPTDPPKLIAAGQADIGISYQPQLYLQAAAGLPLMRVGTLVATPLNSIAVLADGPIKDLSDLRGRKVGFSVAGMEEVLLSSMLKTVGLGLDDVELINVNFALTSALASEQVDAVIGAFRNFEMTQLDLVGRPGRAFFIEEHGIPNHDELIYIVQKGREGEAFVPKFLDAVEAAGSYMINHPDDSLQLFLEAYPDLDDELNRRAFVDTLPRFAHRPRALDKNRYMRFADFMLESGLVDQLPPLSTYAIEP